MARTILNVFVPGVPQPAGSKRAIPNRRTGKPIIVDDCKKSAPWKDTVRVFVSQEFSGEPTNKPVRLHLKFVRARPKSHYRGVKNWLLKANAPKYPTTKPDTTKLVRGVEDALTGIVWLDDSKVVYQTAYKTFGAPGVHVTVEELDE